MTVKQLIRKLKIFGRERFVVVGKKDVVGIDWNDGGDVELVLEGIEDIQAESTKSEFFNPPFAQLQIPNNGYWRFLYKEFLKQQDQKTTTWKKFLSQRCSDLRHSSASLNNLSNGLSYSPKRSK